MTRAGATESVVGGKFLSLADSFQAVEENSSAAFADGEVGIATVVDEFRAASSHSPVNDPAAIQDDCVGPI